MDMQATTPMVFLFSFRCPFFSHLKLIFFFFQKQKDPRVVDTMLPYMLSFFGNPHSKTHAYGWESEKAVEHAREVYIFLSLFGTNSRIASQ